MQVEWTAPHTLLSKFGSLDFNLTDPITLLRYQIQPGGYKIVPSIRVTNDNISQRDGSVLHPRFLGGMVATMTVSLQKMADASGPEIAEFACGADLTTMTDQLTRWTNGMRDLTYADNQRLIWTPTGAIDSRMLIDIELLQWLEPSIDGSEVTASFAVESPFPYAVDFTQNDTAIPDGSGVTIINAGSADTFPVIQVHGTFTSFQIFNNTTGLTFTYDGTRPGATGVTSPDYAEIDMFRGTIFLNGNSTDLIPGVDPANTDFFPITCDPAGNTITANGANIDVLWNRAWA